MPTILPQDEEAAWLMIGAIIGVMMRSWATKGQNPFSRETAQDVFIGLVFAVAWLNPMGSYWPPFTMPVTSRAWMHGVLFAGGTWLFIEMAKTALLAAAPKWFAKYTGQSPPEVKP